VSDRVPMTPRGFQRLKSELKHLKTEQRPSVVKEIEEARAHGDLSENAEYAAARERQSFIEGRIAEIESKLTLADIIDTSKLSGARVVFGAYVTLRDGDGDEEVTYQIVGLDEADMKQRRISVTAPLARAMIGKSVGDEFELKTAKGPRSYEIVAVEFREDPLE